MAKRLRIAIVYHWFAHYREPIMRALVDELKDGFEFTFIADTESLEPAMKVLRPGKSADEVDVAWEKIKNRSLGPFIWQHGLISNLRKSRYDAVIFLGEFRILSTWIAAIIFKCRGKKVYFWSHGVYGDESWLKLKIRLMFYRLAHGIFLYGHYSKQLLVELGFDHNTLFVVYNSLDHESQLKIRQTQDELDSDEFSREKFPNSESAPMLVFVGRLTQRKRVPLLLDAIKTLFDSGIVVNAMIVGGGPQRESLEAYAEELNLRDHVNFSGECHDEHQLAKMIGAATLCVSPGDIGLLAMHSLVYGTPVVTHDLLPAHGPEFEAIIDGETGGFFKHGDAQSLADEIRKWTTIDEDRRATIKNNCFHVVDTFYNPLFQTSVFAEALRGSPPSDAVVSLDDTPPVFLRQNPVRE